MALIPFRGVGYRSRAHEVLTSQLLASFFEVPWNPIVRVLLKKAGIGVVGAQLFHLADDVTRIEMIENAHELSEVDISNARIAANYEHVLIIRML